MHLTHVDQDILAAMDGAWRPAAEIHKRMGVWAPITIRTRLLTLVDRGLVEGRLETGKQKAVIRRKEYRRVGHAA